MTYTPPEVLDKLLENLLKQDENRNNLLRYRLVNCHWRKIIDPHLEKLLDSGILQPFPKLELVSPTGLEQPGPYVHVPILYNEGKPFPFKSLLLSGSFPVARDSVPAFPEENLMPLPLFFSTFGSYLTSFALHNQEITLNHGALILSAMPFLKVLSLSDVMLINLWDPDAAASLPDEPPVLPFLTTLELKSSPNSSLAMEEKSQPLFMWLISSYADQLVSLNLRTNFPFPHLLQNETYHFSVDGHHEILPFTTSADAFKNLKELTIFRPTERFLHFSKTPALQSLTVIATGIDNGKPVDLWKVTCLVDRCRSTLEKLWLDIEGDELLLPPPGRVIHFCPRQKQGEFLPPAKLPKLKTLGIPFPKLEDEEFFTKKFLEKCSELEELHWIRYRFQNDEEQEDAKEVKEIQDEHPTVVDEDSGNLELPDFTADTSSQERVRKAWEQKIDAVALEEKAIRKKIDMEKEKRRFVFSLESQDEKIVLNLKKNLVAVREKRAAFWEHQISLIPLAEQTREQFLIRLIPTLEGYWNTCAKLMRLYVSSWRKAEGDICVIRRGEGTDEDDLGTLICEMELKAKQNRTHSYMPHAVVAISIGVLFLIYWTVVV
ncbi:unnamed protein product [Orchesella dallaii]|uniref:F-box domain-containing protein n=1 Tax=Orchesella dallaii TaxID=48710 RepID=A0ABP1QE72_9HEXA